MRILKNIEIILNEVNSNVSQIIKITIYIFDINLWRKVDNVYKFFFNNHKPVRTIVPVLNLYYGFKIEIDVIAYIK